MVVRAMAAVVGVLWVVPAAASLLPVDVDVVVVLMVAGVDLLQVTRGGRRALVTGEGGREGVSIRVVF